MPSLRLPLAASWSRGKDFWVLAELINLLVEDRSLRDRVVARQKKRAAAFAMDAVRASFWQALAPLGLAP